MKKLTAWAAIIAIPTAITGYFGQNVGEPDMGGLSGAESVRLRRRWGGPCRAARCSPIDCCTERVDGDAEMVFVGKAEADDEVNRAFGEPACGCCCDGDPAGP